MSAISTLRPARFAVWLDGAWIVQPGTYALRVGTSSRELPLGASVVLGPR